MAYEEKGRAAVRHNVILDGRQALSVSGVEDMESFDETGVVMRTSAGTLVVRGGGLRVDKLSIDGGELNIEGRVDLMQYTDEKRTGGSFWSRLFG